MCMFAPGGGGGLRPRVDERKPWGASSLIVETSAHEYVRETSLERSHRAGVFAGSVIRLR